jgi:hypothetical protein
MERADLIALLEEGLTNGRIAPQTAAYIAAEVLGVDASETGYLDWDAGRLAALQALQHEAQPELTIVSA